MSELKQPPFQISEYPHRKLFYLNVTLPTITFALLLLGAMFPRLGTAAAQQEASSLERKADLEIRKLELEVDKLQKEAGSLPSWLTGVLGALLGGVVGAGTTVWVARRTRRGALDQSIHDKRLKFYPQLVRATHPLAIYFPPIGGAYSGAIAPKECEAMGRAMSKWYFDGGGLLMSVDTRNAYFKLARALTLASLAGALSVPKFPTDAKHLSKEQLDLYQEELEKQFNLDDVSIGPSEIRGRKTSHRLIGSKTMSFFSDSVASFGLA